MSAVQQALALAEAGRGADAAALLEHSEAADAATLLALWQVEGRVVARDLAAARGNLVRAAAGGSAGAARTLAGFIATGTGGAANWEGALALLAEWRERDPLAAQQLDLIAAMPHALPEPEPLSDTPWVRRLPGLFTPAECGFLAEVSGPRFRGAQIFHEGLGKFVEDPIRRSDVAGFPIVTEWPLVHALNRRIAAASGTDVAAGEPLQVLRYRPGQAYTPHLDAVRGLANQRRLTMLVWLNDGYEGGETRFLETDLRVRGRVGDALLFRNTLADGNPDPASRHEGMPVTRGEKLLASRWIRERPPGPKGFGSHEAQ